MLYDPATHGPLYDTPGASKYLWEIHGVRASVKSLCNRRYGAGGPAFIRQANKAVRYPQAALDAFAREMNEQPLMTVVPVRAGTARAVEATP